MQLVNEKQDDWERYLSQACWAIRSSYNEATKRTPFEVMFLRKPRFGTELAAADDECIMVDETPSSQIDLYVNLKESEAAKMHQLVNLVFIGYQLFLAIIDDIDVVSITFTTFALKLTGGCFGMIFPIN